MHHFLAAPRAVTVAAPRGEWHGETDALPGARRLLAYSAVAIVLLAITVLGAVFYAVERIDKAAVSHETDRARVALSANALETVGSEARLASLLSNNYALANAHIGDETDIGTAEVAVPVAGSEGRLLIWTPRRFGSELFMQLAPTRVVTSIIFLLGIGYLMRRLYLLARELETRRVEAQALAARDALTGLGNRLAFNNGMERLFGDGVGETALLYLDLDGFKQVNDTLGHGAGDDVLRAVAQRLERLAQPADLLVRLGGDEFVLLRPGRGPREELVRLAEAIRRSVAEPMLLGTQSLEVGVSIGIAVAPADGTTGLALLDAADTALYRAKRDRVGYAMAAAA